MNSVNEVLNQFRKIYGNLFDLLADNYSKSLRSSLNKGRNDFTKEVMKSEKLFQLKDDFNNTELKIKKSKLVSKAEELLNEFGERVAKMKFNSSVKEDLIEMNRAEKVIAESKKVVKPAKKTISESINSKELIKLVPNIEDFIPIWEMKEAEEEQLLKVIKEATGGKSGKFVYDERKNDADGKTTEAIKTSDKEFNVKYSDGYVTGWYSPGKYLVIGEGSSFDSALCSYFKFK